MGLFWEYAFAHTALDIDADAELPSHRAYSALLLYSESALSDQLEGKFSLLALRAVENQARAAISCGQYIGILPLRSCRAGRNTASDAPPKDRDFVIARDFLGWRP
jgi:hypothetical protein